jgi:hypothetical protein
MQIHFCVYLVEHYYGLSSILAITLSLRKHVFLHFCMHSFRYPLDQYLVLSLASEGALDHA